MSNDWRRKQRAFWENRAGPFLAEMLESRQGAERLLEHPDPLVRTVAIEVLQHHWKPDKKLARISERIAFEDPDLTVRAIAIIVLGSCYSYTDDVRIGHIFATVVRDERQPVEFRSAAYNGLFSLRGKILMWDGLYANPPTDFPFPEKVDWSFVDSFLDESRTPSPVDPIRAALPNSSEEEVIAVRLYKQGTEALERHEYQKCVELATETLAVQPDAAGGYRVRGRAYIELGRLDEAIADLSCALELNPYSEESFRERGRAYRLKGAVGLAEQDERAAAMLEESKKRTSLE